MVLVHVCGNLPWFLWVLCQSDPFKFLEKELEEGSTTDLWLSGEHLPYKKIKNCVFNR